MRVRRMVASSICLFVCLVANNVDKGELCSPSHPASPHHHVNMHTATVRRCLAQKRTRVLQARRQRSRMRLWFFVSRSLSITEDFRDASMELLFFTNFTLVVTSFLFVFDSNRLKQAVTTRFERESKSKPRFSIDISLTSFILSQPSVLNNICSRADNVQAEDHASQICCSRKTRGNCKTG